MLKAKDSIKDLHYNERIISIANPGVLGVKTKNCLSKEEVVEMWSFGAALTATIWCDCMDMIP